MTKYAVSLFALLFMTMSASAQDSVTETLIKQRHKFDVELNEKPAVLKKLIYLTHKEVGSQGPKAQQMFIETVMNRANAKKWSLDKTMNPAYYPPLRKKVTSLPPSMAKKYMGMAYNALEGMNKANFATDNASNQKGNRLAAKRQKQGRRGVVEGGEFFYVDIGNLPFFREMDKMFRELDRELNPDRRRPVNPKVKPVKKDEDKKVNPDKGKDNVEKKDDKVVNPEKREDKPVEAVPAPVAPVAPPPAPVPPPPVEDTGWSDWFKSLKNRIEDAIKK